jgi:nitrogen fixation NifU-like protein
MNTDELYHTAILDLSRTQHGYGELECATASATEANRVCGDSVRVFVRVEHDVMQEMSFTGRSCALSTASTALLTVLAQGKTPAEILALRTAFEQFLRSELASAPLTDLQIFDGVRTTPSRIKCVLLGWNALQSALQQSSTQFPTTSA